MSILANAAKPPLASAEKNKKKENNLKKIKQKRKRSAREKIYLGQFQEDLNFLEDFVEFQRLCQHQTKTPYTVRKYFIRKYFMFSGQIPVKNLALSTVNYLVTKSSLDQMKTYFFPIKLLLLGWVEVVVVVV